MNNVLMFATGKDVQTTPKAFYAELDAEFGFTHDMAAIRENSVCGPNRYYGPDHWDFQKRDALTVNWPAGVTNFCNPPYSRPICGQFIAKAAAERKRGVTTVMLLAARTDTAMFHTHVWDRVRHKPRPGVGVRFLKGRLKFNDATHAAPFPSMVVVFKGRHERAPRMQETISPRWAMTERAAA